MVESEAEPADDQVDSAVGEVPLPNAWADFKADNRFPSDSCETYFRLLVQSVDRRLVAKLQGAPEAGGINLRGTLQQQAPLTIDGGGQLQTTKEHWRWENCRASLGSKGLYEAPGSMFWLSKAPPSWYGTLLPASELTYGQMGSGRLVWSDEKFMRSSDDPMKRRYSIRFAISHQPIRGSLLVGLLACLLDCLLAGSMDPLLVRETYPAVDVPVVCCKSFLGVAVVDASGAVTNGSREL